MKNLKKYYLTFGTYQFGYYLLIGDRKKATEFTCKEHDYKYTDHEFSINGRLTYRDGYVPILWFPKNMVKVSEIGTVAHEVFHLICYFFNQIGIKLSKDSEEAWTYQINYVMEDILRKMV